MCEWIENYFTEGEYDLKADLIPTCVYPNGDVRTGKVKIKKYYECGNPKKFLSCQIKSESNVQSSLQSFSSDCLWSFTSSIGTNLVGNIKLCKGKIIICGKGYSPNLGKNIKLKVVTEKTPTGFTEYLYFLNDNKKWQLFSTRINTKILS